MNPAKDQEVEQLLNHIRPWLDAGQQGYLADSAKKDWSARFLLAQVLAESNQPEAANLLLESMRELPSQADETQKQIRIKSLRAFIPSLTI